MIELKCVSKRFGPTEAISQVSFCIHRGEIFGLLGHNGAGKTTTLKIIVELMEPSEGRVERPDDFKSHLGFVPDDPFLFEYLTAREMLHFTGSLYRLPQRFIQARTQSLLGLFELDRQADQLVKTYSRGMRRKLSIIGALLHEPSCLVLDEPTESLDPVAALVLKELLIAKKKENAAIVLSTHQLSLAEALCDRLAILNQGRLIFQGTLQEMRHRAGGAVSLEEVYVRHHLPGNGSISSLSGNIKPEQSYELADQ